MPITRTKRITDRDTNTYTEEVSVEHRGEVVEVRRFKSHRNVSDTLDVSDYQTIDAVEALVYVGRVAPAGSYIRKTVPGAAPWANAVFYKDGEALQPIDRFRTVDCSNVFTWRGCDHLDPRVDDIRHPDCVIDYCEYLEARETAKKEREQKEAAHRRRELELVAEKIKNEPGVGKQMRVKSGRKVPVGTVGTVAYIHSSGRVLLKADTEWKDRKAAGVWVDPKHLEAR